MFAMNQEAIDPLDETPEHPRQRAVNNLTALLAGLTGRLADPGHVGVVIDSISDWCNYTTLNNPMMVIEPATTTLIQDKVNKKGGNDGHL